MEDYVIVFDADGVALQKSCFADCLISDYGITREMTRPFFQSAFAACQLGDADLKQELLPFLESWDWGSSVDEFVDYWLKCDSKTNDELLNYISQLKNLQINCYLASNQENYRATYLKTYLNLDELFDKIFYSSQIGSRKPDKVFFKKITDELKVDVNRIIFFDDSLEIVEASKDFGWKGEHYRDIAQFKSTLKSYEIEIG